MPNRAAGRTSSHDAPTTDAPTTAAQTTVGRIIGQAIAIADAEGLDAVSIRRLASELRTRPMSLYTYIRSKQALFESMGEAVVGEVLVREPLPEDWREALRLIATRSHAVFTAHPWVLTISQQRDTLGHNGLRHAEQQLSAIAPLKLTTRDSWQVLFLINDYTLGHALRVAHAPATPPNSYPTFDSADYPHLARALQQPGPARGVDTFHEGLELLLDAIAKSHLRVA